MESLGTATIGEPYAGSITYIASLRKPTAAIPAGLLALRDVCALRLATAKTYPPENFRGPFIIQVVFCRKGPLAHVSSHL